MKIQPKFNFTISGLIIGILFVSMFAGVFAIFVAGLSKQYPQIDVSNSTINKYNDSNRILANITNIENATNIKQQDGILDVFGGYISAGYSALQVAKSSFSMFSDVTDQASLDVASFAYFKTYIVGFILIGIILGVMIAAIMKWVV